jgi:hypothetical protein
VEHRDYSYKDVNRARWLLVSYAAAHVRWGIRGVGGVDNNRVTVEAAILLGVSEGAIRKRVDWETHEHDKDDGRVYVYLPDGVDGAVDAPTTRESNPLIPEMRSRTDFLEEELRASANRLATFYTWQISE